MRKINRRLLAVLFFLLPSLGLGADQFAIAADGEQPEAQIAKLAGIAPYFHLYDVDGNLLEVLPNPHLDMEYGIGPACAVTLADMGVTVLVARKIPGPKMEDVLNEREVRIVRRIGTVQDVVNELRE
jgi:predicted Fe-Mo cluster-binding NifX family protein